MAYLILSSGSIFVGRLEPAGPRRVVELNNTQDDEEVLVWAYEIASTIECDQRRRSAVYRHLHKCESKRSNPDEESDAVGVQRHTIYSPSVSGGGRALDFPTSDSYVTSNIELTVLSLRECTTKLLTEVSVIFHRSTEEKQLVFPVFRVCGPKSGFFSELSESEISRAVPGAV
ncbi:hypothetical protein PROFUN_08432 [Planoprotostelium fungivorum]|uniref:Uncharacterized protein n=1 Tax=Planoprotostelium fungivorum TaxID=1890364 RepID=A0A2P6NJV9_9EUKA|nr:hypothetical protein PROFUN_08432 [Planoprotostelium fungivorum]